MISHRLIASYSQAQSCEEAIVIQFIEPDHYGAFAEDLVEMHRLRYRIFKERLGWEVEVSGGMEADEFDACRPVYLLQKDLDGQVRGCVRLLPTTGPTMLGSSFPALLDGQAAPVSAAVWESSRFGVDLGPTRSSRARNIAKATYELFAGMIEFGLMRQLTDIVTVTDARMERILCRACWPLRRIGMPRPLGKTIAVAGYLEVSKERLQLIRDAAGFSSAVISVEHSKAIEAVAA